MPNKDTVKTVLAPSRLKRFTQYLALLMVTIALGVGVYFLAAASSLGRRNVAIGGEAFTLEVASDDESREQGLSGRDNLSQGAGMLFDFGKLGDWQIWMKDMRFNIDILWLDDNGKVVGVETDVSPSTYPQNFGADSPSRYVIELPAGTAEHLGLRVGNAINLQ